MRSKDFYRIAGVSAREVAKATARDDLPPIADKLSHAVALAAWAECRRALPLRGIASRLAFLAAEHHAADILADPKKFFLTFSVDTALAEFIVEVTTAEQLRRAAEIALPVYDGEVRGEIKNAVVIVPLRLAIRDLRLRLHLHNAEAGAEAA